MVDLTECAVDPGELEAGLAAPQFDSAFFSEQGFGDGCNGSNDGVIFDDLDFDFPFDDLPLPLSEESGSRLNHDLQHQSDLEAAMGSNLANFAPNFDQLRNVFKSTSEKLRHISGNGEFFGDQSRDGSTVMDSTSPAMDSNQISAYLNMQSPESNGSNRDSADNHCNDVKEFNSPSSESHGSKDLGSESSNNSAAISVSSAPISSKNSILAGVVDQKIKTNASANNDRNSSVLKRKKEEDEYMVNSNSDSWSNECMKSNHITDNNDCEAGNGVLSEEDEKRRARLMRNRESAQLSRQRKKHYVEELENKVKTMHSTIQDLNSKISFFMAENVALKQQMCTSTGAAPSVPPPHMAPPPPGMYPHPAMMYPWMPCPPPYMVKPQGSQVPLLPIPKLKPQQPAQALKTSKKVESNNKNDAPKPKKEKVESKKIDGPKTKKVASMSILGLLLFTMFFGCLVPLVNVRYGGMKETLVGEDSYIRGGSTTGHHRRVLMLNVTDVGDRNRSSAHGEELSDDEFANLRNESEPLAASLYVPRNDKLVKIDGNLIIHSVLASEKAMALAVPGDLVPAITIPGVGMNSGMHSHMRALGSSSTNNDGKSSSTDGKLQQWFREGLAGPMLTAGMCTEVFRFDVSTAIVPATLNITENEMNPNTTHLSKGMSRRHLNPGPIPVSATRNISDSSSNSSSGSDKERFSGSSSNSSSSSMVVSILFDPRETGDGDVDGVMGTKTLSRIFVVVLVDSVKYVTYSCVLPFKGSSSAAPHLVTA